MQGQGNQGESVERATKTLPTSPLTKSDRRLIADYRDSRQKVINLAAEGQSLAKRMHDAEAEVPRLAAKLATQLSIRLGFASYQELKDQGLDLSIDSKAGTVAVVKQEPKVEPKEVEEERDRMRDRSRDES